MKTLALSILILAGLSACTPTRTPDKCVPPQVYWNGLCTDRDGAGDGQGQPDAPAEPEARSRPVKR